MVVYKNLSGASDIEGYDIFDYKIEIKYKGIPKKVTYSYVGAGKYNVEKMKEYALNGYGLSTYINQHCRKYHD